MSLSALSSSIIIARDSPVDFGNVVSKLMEYGFLQ